MNQILGEWLDITRPVDRVKQITLLDSPLFRLRLGEHQPKEFAQFIGKEMCLGKVEYALPAKSTLIFNFCVGKNTPERKDYIMERLVVPVEEQSASRPHDH